MPKVTSSVLPCDPQTGFYNKMVSISKGHHQIASIPSGCDSSRSACSKAEEGKGQGPGPGQGDFEENTRGTEKSVANEGHQSLIIALEGRGGVENFYCVTLKFTGSPVTLL